MSFMKLQLAPHYFITSVASKLRFLSLIDQLGVQQYYSNNLKGPESEYLTISFPG